MSDETPAVIPQEPAQLPAQPQGPQLPEALRAVLQRTGTMPDAVKVYEVPEYAVIELENLCTLPTSRKDCEGESPVLVVQRYSTFDDANDFKGYVGFFRAECVSEYGDLIAFSHYMYHADTGEAGPIWDFFRAASLPFAIKIANMSTRKGFNVLRPIPVVFGVDRTAS